MTSKPSNSFVIMSGVSAMALCAVAWAAPAYAQQTDAEPAAAEEDDTLVIVTGIRKSLQNAQAIKRNADTFVDSITSDDIGAFPDRSVTEALQRVPGVTISRFGGGNDPNRASPEGQGVTIRGLNLTRSEFNGRDTFTANSYRVLSFEDVGPELMGGVDVYKNQTADMIEGGIAGTINLRTRLPFDSNGLVYGLSADASYGDLAKELTPTISGGFSNRWSTDLGEFGFLVNFAHSKLDLRNDMTLFQDLFQETNLIPGQTITIPGQVQAAIQDYERTRSGQSAAIQWESPEKRFLATFQYFRSLSDSESTQHTLALDQPSDGSLRILPGTTPRLSGNRMIAGSLTATNNNFWPFFGTDRYPTAIDSQATADVPYRELLGPNFQQTTNVIDIRQLTKDYAFNLKFDATERLRFNFDVQYVESEVDVIDWQTSFLNKGVLNFNLGGDFPSMSFGLPYEGAPAGYFNDRSRYWVFPAMDHLERSDGDETAYRADVEYDIDAGWLEGVRAGIRHSERDQRIRWSTYNWGAIGEPWNPAGWQFVDDTNFPTERYSFENFAHGDSNPGTYLFPDTAFLRDYDASSAYLYDLDRLDPNSQFGWTPLWYRNGTPCRAKFDAASVNPGENPTAVKCSDNDAFLPGEINNTNEKVDSAYVRMDFSGMLGGFDWDGNFGVRYVKTTNETDGAATFNNQGFVKPLYCTLSDPNLTPEQNQRSRDTSAICFVDQAEFNFSNGANQARADSFEDEQVLPSFNVKVNVTEDSLIRFAASKAISRPDLGLLRNFTTINPSPARGRNAQGVFTDTIDACSNVLPIDPLPAQCVITSAILQDSTTEGPAYTGNGGNPVLKPMEATQFDLSYEWYFSDVGSFTFTVFHKDVKNFITGGIERRTFTNNGVTRTVDVTTNVNGDKGEVQGFEIAYTQFYDFLPAPFDGLGLQANYTYIDSNGKTKGNVDETGGSFTPTADYDLPLERLSKYNGNLVGMYQKGPIEGRLAYSWRSEYLITSRNSIFPNRPVFADEYGQLDGSISYALNDHLRFGVDAQNLLNSIQRTTTFDDDATTRIPHHWFQGDRRVSFVVRANF